MPEPLTNDQREFLIRHYQEKCLQRRREIYVHKQRKARLSKRHTPRINITSMGPIGR